MKKKSCYALFIGIDSYENATIPDLSGCVKDAQRFLDYLIHNINEEKFLLHARPLFTGTNTPPTRANIIASIREHLGQAQEGDLVLLFYAGHGSKEVAPAHFLEADGHLQTLVPADARQPTKEGLKVRNILDKEIRLLLDEIWQKTQAEIVFVQDSCHSTGATRQMEQLKTVVEDLKKVESLLAKEGQEEVLPTPVARYVDPSATERSTKHWEQLTAEALALQYTAFAEAPELLELLRASPERTVSTNNILPLAPHIHLAACDKAEFAYEIPNKGGVFTTNLLEILEASQNTISYHDLYNRARLNIAGAYQQTPDLFVHHKAFEKRHQVFLGGLLQQGKLPAQREVDVFKGFFPVLPKGRSSWQIKAGEMELLGQINSPEKAIPIEVFLQDEQPTGQSNAVISSVRSTFSKIEFNPGVSFDRRKHRNKLYGMIAPHFLRRWRVSTFVETTAGQGSLKALFEDYGPRKQLKNFRHDGGPAVRLAKANQPPHFVIKVEGDWLHLYDNQNQLLLKATAAQRQVEGQTQHLPLSAPAEGTAIYHYLPQGEKELSNPENWSFSPYQKNALVALFDYLAAIYNKNTQQSVLVQLEEASTAQHPFVDFLKQEEATLTYFEAFIHWKEQQEEAGFIIRTSPEGFSIHRQVEGQVEAVPVCRQTAGLGKQQGFEVILALQHICKWQTVKNLYNQLQLALLDKHQFQLEATIFTDFEAENRGQRTAVFNSLEDSHYQNKERGISLPLHELTTEKAPLHLVQHPQYPSTIVLPMSLVLHHLEGDKEVYVSTLLLDSNFAVLPLQTAMGNNVLPPKESSTDEKGSLWISPLTIHRPDQLANFPQELESATFYIKILVAYERFDVSSLLQRGLPPAAPAFMRMQQGSEKTRAKVLRAPRKGEAGSWLSFTIPLVVEQPL